MNETKDQPKKVGTCFDGPTCAEMMEKLLAAEGIGSLCGEMMRSLVKACSEGRTEERKNHEFKAAQGQSKQEE